MTNSLHQKPHAISSHKFPLDKIVHLQRLQSAHPQLPRHCSCQERQQRTPRRPGRGDPPDGAGDERARDDAPRVADGDGVHRTQEDADQEYGNGVYDEEGN
jgi:hypothetical protein